jgi:hypothetical protein
MWKRLSRLQRVLLIVVAYAVVIGIWAVRPLSESIAVGTDWTPTLLDPPQGSKEVRQEVSCNSLLSTSARPDEPLPALTPQPPDKPPLAYHRVPCEFAQSDARKTFVIDVVAIGVALGLIAWIVSRRRKTAAALA